MKIFFPIGAFYPDESGGPSLTVYWIAKAISKKGISCVIITTDIGIKGKDIKTNFWYNKDFGKIIYLKTFFHRYLPFKLIFLSLKEIMNSNIIYLTTIFYPGSIACFIIAKIFNKKIIWSPRGGLDDKEMKYNYLLKKSFVLFLKPFISNVYFHTTCNEESEYTKKQFGKNIKIIQITNYMFLPELETVNKENYIAYIGRINPKKAIENLIQAIPLSEKFMSSKYILKIAGDYSNSYGKKLFQLVNELKLNNKVKFVGHIDKREKFIYLAKSYFTFMPSHTENFGVVVAESLSQGTPAVATTGSPWEKLQEWNAGYWIDNSPNSLAIILDKIISLSDFEYNLLCINSRNLVVREFDINNNVDVWIKSFNTILSN